MAIYFLSSSTLQYSFINSIPISRYFLPSSSRLHSTLQTAQLLMSSMCYSIVLALTAWRYACIARNINVSAQGQLSIVIAILVSCLQMQALVYSTDYQLYLFLSRSTQVMHRMYMLFYCRCRFSQLAYQANSSSLATSVDLFNPWNSRLLLRNCCRLNYNSLSYQSVRGWLLMCVGSTMLVVLLISSLLQPNLLHADTVRLVLDLSGMRMELLVVQWVLLLSFKCWLSIIYELSMVLRCMGEWGYYGYRCYWWRGCWLWWRGCWLWWMGGSSSAYELVSQWVLNCYRQQFPIKQVYLQITQQIINTLILLPSTITQTSSHNQQTNRQKTSIYHILECDVIMVLFILNKL